MKKRSSIAKLFMYKVNFIFLIMISLISLPNKEDKLDKAYYFIPSKNNVTIIDERNILDPNVEVLNSYKINDIFKMMDIINEIIKYEEINPSNWDRNKYGMFAEWTIHNMAYNLGFFTESSASVDFSSFEENFYSLGLKKE